MSTLDQLFNSFTNKIESNLQTTKHEILNKWKHIGLPITKAKFELTQLQSAILSNISVFSTDQIKFADNMETNLLELNEKIIEHCKILNLSKNDFLINKKTINETYENSKINFKKLETIINERVNEYKACQETETILLERLKMTDRYEMYFKEIDSDTANNQNSIPSENSIKDYKNHVQNLEKKVEARINWINNFKTNYIEIISKLCELPEEDSFGYQFIQNPVGAEFYDLSDEFFNETKKTLREIEQFKENRIKEIKFSVKKIKFIIEKLNLTEKNIQNYDLENVSTQNYNYIIEELNTFEKIKLKKLGELINISIFQISELSEKAFLSELEVLRFNKQVLDKCDNDEDKFDKLEHRINTLNDHIESNTNVFELVNEWKEAFKNLNELEESEKDPARLFKNRGGSLMAQMKKMNKLKNRLPRIENKLLLLQENLGENCVKLEGYDIAEYLENEHATYEQDRNDERECKKFERQQQLFQESIYGTTPVTKNVKKPVNNKNTTKRILPTPSSNSRNSSKQSSQLSGKSSSSNRSRGRTLQKQLPSQASNNANKFLKNVFEIENKENILPKSLERKNVNIIKQKIEKRRSRTPETLSRTKNSKYNPRHKFGFRRRSKSTTNLACISEKVAEKGAMYKIPTVTEMSTISNAFTQTQLDQLFSENSNSSCISAEKFNQGLRNKKNINNDKSNQPISSSFIGDYSF